MATEGFSTGSIFVSVVPVFRDFQNDIAKEAEKANRRARKSVENLGKEQVKQAELTAAEVAKVNERARKAAITEEEKAAKAIADAKIKQAREANRQAVKDEETLRAAEGKRLREQMEAEAKIAKARADALEKQAREEEKAAAALAKSRAKAAEKAAAEEAKIRAMLARDEAREAQKLADAKIRQAQRANAQAIKDEEALRKAESDRIRARMESDAKAAKAKADAEIREQKRSKAEGDKLAREIEQTAAAADLAAKKAKIALDQQVARAKAHNAKMQADAVAHEKKLNEIRLQEWEKTAGTFARSWHKEMRKATEAISKDATGELGKIRKEFERLSTQRVGVGLDISPEEASKVAQQLHGRLRKAMRSRRVSAADLLDLSSAERGLRGFVRDTEKAHRATGLFSRGLRSLHQDGVQAANSFRVFNPYLIAVVGLLTALPALSSAAGAGILALGTSFTVASTGIAAMIFGFSGLGDAMTALQNQTDSATQENDQHAKSVRSASYAVSDARKALADAERSAARAAEDAAERVADAREQAADSIRDALERQREAQESYRDAVESVREAELDLAAARKQAREDARDLGLDIQSNKLAQEEGLLNEFNAKVAYDAARADGSATNAEVEQARINWEQAKIQQERLRIEGKRLSEEKKKWDKEGVEGADVVKTAQERLTDAIENQRDAVKDLGKASAAVDEARREGAESVAEALRDQAEVNADNARSVSTAQESLRRAQEAMVDTTTEMSTTASATEIAMGKLSASGQAFALYLMGVRGQFRDLRNDIQDVFLPSVQAAMDAVITKNGPAFRAFMLSMAAVMGTFFTDLADSINGPAMQSFFAAFANIGPAIQGNLNNAFISFLEAMAGIMKASLPFTEAFTAALADLMDRFANWSNSAEGQKAITDFLERAAETGPKVVEFFADLVTFFFKFGQAMMPISLTVLEGLGNFLEWVSGLDPIVLQAVGAGLLAVFAFVQIVSGAGALMAGLALVTGPVAWAIAGVLALAAAFVILWTTSETFREKVKDLMGYLKEQFSDKIWGPIQEPLDKLGAAFTRLWEEVLQPFIFNHLVPALEWLGREVVPVLFGAIGAIIVGAFKVIAWWIEHIVIPGFQIMGAAIQFLWDWVVKPVFGFIRSLWAAVAAAFEWTWENVLRPVFQAFALVMEITWKAIKIAWDKWGQPAVDWIKGSLKSLATWFGRMWKKYGKPAFDAIKPYTLDPFVNAFRWAVGKVKDHWDGLKKVLAAPIVVGFKIVNSLIDGLNALGKRVGAKSTVDNVEAPGWLKSMAGGGSKKSTLTAQGQKNANRFATGGILPGYTPGRDVHTFMSPTAGRLHLSGGEAIMRPEWTAAMGPAFVNRMNALARKGGVAAIRKAMMGGQAYAKGGVFWPLPGGIASTYGGHDGVDLNSPNDYGKPYYAAVGGKIAYVGYGRGYGNAVFQQTKYGTLVYGHSSAVGVRPGQVVAPGQMLGRVGNTGNSTGPHLHFGFPGGTYGQAMALLRGAAKAGYGPASPWAEAGGGIPSIVSKVLDGPLDVVKGWAKKATDSLLSKFDSPYAKIVAEAPAKMFGAVAAKAKDMIPGWMKDVASLTPLGGLLGLLGGKASGNVQKQAQTALGEAGFGSWASGSQWAALKQLVQHESSWNPSAKNPSSTAEGLFQFLASTRSAYGLKSGASVADQTIAGARYIKDRYGTPKGAWDFWQRNHWYSDGGIYGDAPTAGPAYQAGDNTAAPGASLPYNGTMQYDSGGILPTGLTTVVNLTGKPERIFTDSQFEAMKGGSRGGSFTYAPTFNQSDLTSADVAQDLNFTFRKLTRGGKYAGLNG
jgi:murein DD-endopeptidase MepM/ murein hydrolase activator NlpD